MKKILILFSLLHAEGEIAPTEKSSWGVEVNPFRLLSIDDDWQSFSGTMSYFDNENGTELAIPIFYSKEQYDSDSDIEEVLNIDLDYRKYLSGNRTKGVYLGVFGRYTYIDAKVWNTNKYATVQKFGLGGVIGYRFKDAFNLPFYWGANFKIGRHLGNDNDIFNSSSFSMIDDNQLIIDIELFKVGYEF